MPDPLHEAIARALRERQLDGRLFERCAVDLLRDAWYPDLRGTPHGRDAGADGISGPDAWPDFVLVATTAKDYAHNLRESVERHLDVGGRGRAFVLATTREVTVERRLSLTEELKQRGVRLLAVHDRGDFERLLYRSPRWSKDLLGVTGAEAALSRFPVRSRPAFPIRPIGRDADLERLRAAEGDLVLAGKPGAGKTFLLEWLADEGWCLFDAGRGPGELADAVRELRPRRVALDDAHLSTDRLAEVLHVREVTGADFRIAAVSWPGRADEVAAYLPDAERIDVGALERDRIVGIAEAAGVAGPPDLQRLIADQARGLPGLAAALARACVSGGVRKVVSGEALLADLARWYRRTLGEESLQALGALALAGDWGATAGQIGGILGMDLARTGNLIRGLADGGTIDEADRPLSWGEIYERTQGERTSRPDWLCVQPETLRYALVRDVFFGGPGSLDAFRAVEGLDDRSIAALPLIGAAHRGAPVDRKRLQKLVHWGDGRVVEEYALLGPSELRTALERAPAHRTHIAGAAFASDVDRGYALRVLMEQAEGDGRAEHGAPDHPLRIVEEYLAHPETRPGTRRLAAGVADGWLRDGGDAHVGIRVLMHAVNPAWVEHSIDPGVGTTVRVRRGLASPATIEELGGLWGSILAVTEREAGVNPDLPVGVILDGLRRWADPGSIGGPAVPHAETAATMRRVAGRVAGRLADIFAERPGVLHSLREYAERGGIDVRIDVPDWFAELFPGQEVLLENGGREAFARQAEELAARPDAEVAEHLMFLEREARLAGLAEPGGARLLAGEIAARDERPEEMLEELDRRGADSGLLGWFLDRAAELRRPGWETAAERLIEREATSEMAASVALVRPAGTGLKRLAIRRAAPRLIKSLVGADAIDHATLTLLFEEPDSVVARTAALALGRADTLGDARSRQRLAGLPSRLRDRWRKIVVGSPPEGVIGRWDGSLARILERDRDLCAEWVRAWFGRLREHGSEAYEPAGIEIERAVGGLPADVRAELIADVPAEALSGVIRSLVSGDVAAAEALFARPDLERLHYCALASGPEDLGEAWMERALLAMGRGWEPERIVESLLYGVQRLDSDESEHWRRYAEAFERLHPAPERPEADRRKRIADAGIARFGKLRDDAARSERDERVYSRRR